jgi:glutamate-1-semialdehyde 2,1-aminomutase
MDETLTQRRRQESRRLLQRAQTVMPGGVSSPVRSFHAVGGQPLFIDKASGAYICDVDGNEYIDFLGSWGAMIAGHAHPAVVRAVQCAAERGTSYGAPVAAEIELAQRIQERAPSIEMIRFVNSGTEATMSALRLARAATGRNMILKFDGCYHGHSDSLLISAGSGPLTLGQPDSPGVPASLATLTLSIPFNDVRSVEHAFELHPDEIAAVIIEPIAGNMGVVSPSPGFLERVFSLCREHGALLIFDEVITGFRVARGGAQQLYRLEPDLTTFGKIMGGGLPVGAYGGSLRLMEMISPAGPVYQAGTLSGNPLVMAAGIATLGLLEDSDSYRILEVLSSDLEKGLTSAARDAGVAVSIGRVGSMLTLFFTDQPVGDYVGARNCDGARFARFHAAMLDLGIYLPPSPFESWFVSLAHTSDLIERTVAGARKALEAVADVRARGPKHGSGNSRA